MNSSALLRELREADQLDRKVPGSAIDWTVVSPRDQARRNAVAELLACGEVRTAEDFYNAALVYQHGDTAGEIRLAYSLATISASLRPDIIESKWLCAAAWDRLLKYLGRPQWYGTQYIVSPETGKREMYRNNRRAALRIHIFQGTRQNLRHGAAQRGVSACLR